MVDLSFIQTFHVFEGSGGAGALAFFENAVLTKVVFSNGERAPFWACGIWSETLTRSDTDLLLVLNHKFLFEVLGVCLGALLGRLVQLGLTFILLLVNLVVLDNTGVWGLELFILNLRVLLLLLLYRIWTLLITAPVLDAVFAVFGWWLYLWLVLLHLLFACFAFGPLGQVGLVLHFLNVNQSILPLDSFWLVELSRSLLLWVFEATLLARLVDHMAFLGLWRLHRGNWRPNLLSYTLARLLSLFFLGGRYGSSLLGFLLFHLYNGVVELLEETKVLTLLNAWISGGIGFLVVLGLQLIDLLINLLNRLNGVIYFHSWLDNFGAPFF